MQQNQTTLSDIFDDIKDILKTPVNLGMAREAARRLKLNKVRRRLSAEGVGEYSETSKGQELKTRVGQFALEGLLSPGKATVYSVAREDFVVSDETWVVGNLEYGAKVIVKGTYVSGERHATSVLIVK